MSVSRPPFLRSLADLRGRKFHRIFTLAKIRRWHMFLQPQSIYRRADPGNWVWGGIDPLRGVDILMILPAFRKNSGGSQWRIQDFPEEGAPTPRGGRQPMILSNFAENCMKMKKFWPPGGARVPCAPP